MASFARLVVQGSEPVLWGGRPGLNGPPPPVAAVHCCMPKEATPRRRHCAKAGGTTQVLGITAVPDPFPAAFSSVEVSQLIVFQ